MEIVVKKEICKADNILDMNPSFFDKENCYGCSFYNRCRLIKIGSNKIKLDEDLGFNNEMPDEPEHRRKIIAVRNVSKTMGLNIEISQIKVIINAIENYNDILAGD